MGQLLIGFALGWLAFTKEGKDVAEKVSAYLSDSKSDKEKRKEDDSTISSDKTEP